MKKKSLSAKKIIHKSLLDYLKNKKINKIFKSFKNYLDKYNDKKIKIGAAISGGPDSLALAYLTKCYLLINKSEGNFFVVDHKLRKESTKEANFVKKSLKKFDINCKILTWRGKKPRSNIQGIARNNRYDLLKKACKKDKINCLLIGHHVDDLYENFFIRLLRGSGLKGLSSFGEAINEKQNNILILRPFVEFEKKELVYISKRVFKFFVKDPSNQNINFQRTRIRKLIFDLNTEGLDKKKLNLTIRNLKSANSAMNFYVEKNICDNAKFNKQKNTYILNQYFIDQPKEVIFRSISLILKKISDRYYSPRGKSISDLITKIKSTRSKKFTLGGCYIEKVNKSILITREN